MTDGLSRERNFSQKEKKRIVRQMKKGYKQMAPLNRKLAEDYFVNIEGEADK